MVDAVIVIELFGISGVVDSGTASNKADVSIRNYREPVSKRVDKLDEVGCFERPGLDHFDNSFSGYAIKSETLTPRFGRTLD